MWVLCFLLFASGSAFPFGGRATFGRFHVQPAELHIRQKLCVPSPLVGQICLPSAFQFFFPLQSFWGERHSCLSIPLIRTYTIKVCPSQTSAGENSQEITKEEEEETEGLPDNANIEVAGEQVEPENFVKNGEDSRLGGDAGSENKIVRLSEEIIQVSKASDLPSLESVDKNFDENVSITSNLV